jgi:hypothetical protein
MVDAREMADVGGRGTVGSDMCADRFGAYM